MGGGGGGREGREEGGVVVICIVLIAEELAAVHRSGQGLASSQEIRPAEESVDFPQPPVSQLVKCEGTPRTG
jgi:hypothetical protein